MRFTTGKPHMDSSQDRTLPATPRRLQKAKEQGQVPRSRDLTHLVVLGGGMLMLSWLAVWMFDRMREGLRRMFSFDESIIKHPQAMGEALVNMSHMALLSYLPLGVLVAFAALATMVASGAYAYSTESLMPKLSKISPLSGFGRLFSAQQMVEVLKLTFIMLVMAVIAGLFVHKHLYDFASLMLRPLEASLEQLREWLASGVKSMLAVVFVVTLIDVPLQRFLHQRRLRMSLQEVKDENKESEGNPEIKGRQRQRQREMSQGNSVKRVPEADLVVMNPTHYAVALKYDDSMPAPQVIAKGADMIALRIRDMAQEHKVPVLQSPMLARALYAHTEIDQQIPTQLFTAVAQVLAYVYQLRAALRGEGPMPGQPPVPDVPVELDPHHGRETAPAATVV